MKKKLTLELVEKAARQLGATPDLRQGLVEMLADLLADGDDEEAEKTPAVKKQWVFLLADPRGKLTDKFLEESGLGALTGWVVQVPEDESPHTAAARIKDGADIFNCSKKGRLNPVQTVGEACENVPAKIFKEAGVWVKTKMPVYAIPCSNELPETPSVLGSDRGSAK